MATAIIIFFFLCVIGKLWAEHERSMRRRAATIRARRTIAEDRERRSAHREAVAQVREAQREYKAVQARNAAIAREAERQAMAARDLRTVYSDK